MAIGWRFESEPPRSMTRGNLIELRCGKGTEPVDLTRSIRDQRDEPVDRSPARNRFNKRIPKTLRYISVDLS
jgi:hypothetical protein